MNAMLVYTHRGGSGILVDPGDEIPRILARIQELDLKIEGIVFTHGHIDHVAYAEQAREALKVPTFMHKDDWEMARMVPQQAAMFGLPPCQAPTIDRELPGEGDFELAGLSFQMHHTPGHSPGSVTMVSSEHNFALVGDLVFAGSVGRTDLPGCSPQALDRSIKEVILPLPDDMVLYPGHGPSTTVGREKASNPFIVPLL